MRGLEWKLSKGTAEKMSVHGLKFRGLGFRRIQGRRSIGVEVDRTSEGRSEDYFNGCGLQILGSCMLWPHGQNAGTSDFSRFYFPATPLNFPAGERLEDNCTSGWQPLQPIRVRVMQLLCEPGQFFTMISDSYICCDGKASINLSGLHANLHIQHVSWSKEDKPMQNPYFPRK